VKRLREALSAKERAEMLLSNLEKLKTEGTLGEDEHAHLKLEYSGALTQATSQVEQIHRELDAQVVAKKREIEAYSQQLKNLETRLKVGELDATEYSTAVQKTQRVVSKLEQAVAEMETLRRAASSAELGGPVRVSTAAFGSQSSPTRSGRTLTENVDDRQWAMLLHLSMLLGILIPLAGYVVPILIWQFKKEEIPEIDDHGKVAVNWLISELIYGCVALVLTLVVIGLPLLIALGAIGIAFPIVGGIKANNGVVWKYPLSIRFVK